ncbi:hypothetical protein EBU99_12815 [bacterium]|nr:hypothetical protein [bacterium]
MNQYNRRQLLRAALLGGLGYGAMAGLSRYGFTAGLNAWYEKFRAANPWAEGMDAITVLRDALNGGPSALFVSQALAAGASPVSFLDIFMATSHDPRNFLNLTEFGNANDPTKTLVFPDAMNPAVKRDLLATHPAFAAAKVNKFFGDMLLSGKYMMNGTPTVLPNFTGLIGDIDPSKIAITSFVSYQGTGVHQQGAIPAAGSIAHMIQASAQLSPIGVAAFGAVSVIDNNMKSVSAGRKSKDFVATLDQLIATSYVDKSKDDGSSRGSNKQRIFDELNGNPEAVALRSQWLENLEKIRAEVADLKANYSSLGSGMFNVYGNINCDRAASIAVAAKLAKSGLGTVATVGLQTPDFHATDASRAPSGDSGNMVTAIAEAALGANVYIKSRLDARQDGVIFIRTCSGRSADWVQDSSTVSGLAIFIKGSSGSALSSIVSEYYGPTSTVLNGAFVDASTKAWAGGVLGLDGGTVTAAQVDGTVAQAVVNAAGRTLSIAPQAKLGRFKKV